MFNRIVVGYDDSEGAQDALALGRLLADRTGGKLVLGGVIPDRAARLLARAATPRLERDVEDELSARVERAAAAAGARAEVILSGSPAHGLHDLVEDLRADLIVLGSSKARPGHVRAGRTATQLLQGGPAAVALAPVGYRYDNPALRVIGIGIDGSAESEAALRAAIELADGGTLRLMSVAVAAAPVGPYWGYGSFGYGLQELAEAGRDSARAHLDAALAQTPDELRPAATVLDGSVPDALRDEADKGLDLLCLGSRGYGPVRRVLLGSVSAAVTADAPCPVLVVPRSDARQRTESVYVASEEAAVAVPPAEGR